MRHLLFEGLLASSFLLCVKGKVSLSRVRLFVTPWIVAQQAPLSVHGILQERILEWQPVPSAGDLPDPGIKPGSPALQMVPYHLSHEVALAVLSCSVQYMIKGSES